MCVWCSRSSQQPTNVNRQPHLLSHSGSILPFFPSHVTPRDCFLALKKLTLLHEPKENKKYLKDMTHAVPMGAIRKAKTMKWEKRSKVRGVIKKTEWRSTFLSLISWSFNYSIVATTPPHACYSILFRRRVATSFSSTSGLAKSVFTISMHTGCEVIRSRKWEIQKSVFSITRRGLGPHCSTKLK